MRGLSCVLQLACAAVLLRFSDAACGSSGGVLPQNGGFVLRGRRTAPTPTMSPSVPTSPIVPSMIAAVGYKSFCMVVTGEVRCWGDDANGVLGYTHDQPSDYLSFYENSTSFAYTTADFTCNVDADIASVPAVPFGATHPRAVEVVGSPTVGGACARFENGGVKCWGHNFNGALGQGYPETRLSVEDIPNLPFIQFASSSSGRPTLAAQLVSSDKHRCILSTEHEVHCWGAYHHGVLGYGNTASVGTQIKSVQQAGAVPLWDEGETIPVQIAVSDRNTCVLMNDGTVGCWGDRSNHRDGVATTAGGSIGDQPDEVCDIDPLNFVVPDGVHVVSIHGKRTHMCAVLSDGTSSCWGANYFGALGLDTSDNDAPVSAARVAVVHETMDFQPLPSTDAMSIGNAVTCILGRAQSAATPQLKCWGKGSIGLLAQNNTLNFGDSYNPVVSADFVNFGAVSSGYAPRQVTFGDNSACAVLAARDLSGAAQLNQTAFALSDADSFAVRCWGYNRGCALGVLGSSNLAQVGHVNTSSVAAWPNAFEYTGTGSQSQTPVAVADDVPAVDDDSIANAGTDSGVQNDDTDSPGAGGQGSASTQLANTSNDDGMGAGAIAGVVIGVVIAVAGVAAFVWWKLRPPARPAQVQASSASAETNETTSAGAEGAANFAGSNPMTPQQTAAPKA